MPSHDAASGRTWVNCPICGEPDMRREADGDEGGGIITCTNLACPSNGGAAPPAASVDEFVRAYDSLDHALDNLLDYLKLVRWSEWRIVEEPRG